MFILIVNEVCRYLCGYCLRACLVVRFSPKALLAATSTERNWTEQVGAVGDTNLLSHDSIQWLSESLNMHSGRRTVVSIEHFWSVLYWTALRFSMCGTSCPRTEPRAKRYSNHTCWSFGAAHWTRKHEWTDRSRTFLNYQSTPCIALQAYYSLNAVRFSLVSAPMQFFPTCNIRFSSTSPVPSWSIRFARSASVPFSTGCSEQALSITHQHI